MTSPLNFKGRNEVFVRLRFGSGLHTRASIADIDPSECTDGQNFLLDLENRNMRNRPPFDLVATATNTSEIRGFASLLKSDGTVKLGVQAGTDFYDWDGAASFTDVGNVSANAKLRGRLEANFKPQDKVLIADMNLADGVYEWDGTTFALMTHNLPGTFKAKYITVSRERAWYAHVEDNSTTTRHMIVGSAASDHDNLSTSAQAPSSASGAGDAIFVLAPDLYPINGLVEAFGQLVVSTQDGSIFKVPGAFATDFQIGELYPRSAADGDESMVFIGNDVAYGRQGAIESLKAAETFGDVEVDDLSRGISDQITTYDDWTAVYNSRTKRAYFLPGGKSEVWVLEKPLLATGLSPWAKYTTAHALAFQPTAIMNCLDPQDGLEYVFMGDASGNIYRLEGTGASGDGGTTDILTQRKSALYEMPVDAEAYDISGWIRYKRKSVAASVTLKFEWNGASVFDESITLTIPAAPTVPVYGSGSYYKNSEYYGQSFTDRLYRQKFSPAGQSNEFQVVVEHDSTEDIDIEEIGLRMAAAS